MGITKFPPVEAPPHRPDTAALTKYVGDLANIVAVISKNLDYLLNGMLDVRNIRAEGIEAHNIKASTITADKMNVSELSAIAANLGTVTAGTIIGLLIETAASGNYPRIEINPSSHYILVEESSSNSYKVDPSFIGVTSPASLYQVGSFIASIAAFSAFGANTLLIHSPEDIDITVGSGKYVKYGSWSEIYSTTEAEDLATAFNNKADTFTGWTGSFDTGAQVVTVSNGIITSVV